MNNQKRLAYIVQQFIKPEEWPSLRGVIANWEDQRLCVKFFFSEEISDHLKEEASVLATEILAQFNDCFLDEKYIYVKPSHPLPASLFWVYRNSEER